MLPARNTAERCAAARTEKRFENGRETTRYMYKSIVFLPDNTRDSCGTKSGGRGRFCSRPFTRVKSAGTPNTQHISWFPVHLPSQSANRLVSWTMGKRKTITKYKRCDRCHESKTALYPAGQVTHAHGTWFLLNFKHPWNIRTIASSHSETDKLAILY